VYVLSFPSGAQEILDGQVTVAIAVVAPTRWTVGTDGVPRADLDADGTPESARVCTSLEGAHFTIWTGAPRAAMRRWHRYYYLGMDLEPSCTEAETTP
jgi:hypothetical protein